MPKRLPTHNLDPEGHATGHVVQVLASGLMGLAAPDAEYIRDTIGSALVPGANITITVNDAGDTITITSANTTDPEVVRDTMGTALVSGANVTITVNDAGDTITIAAVGTDPEIVRDTIGSALVAGSGINIVVNDAGDTITISATAVPVTKIWVPMSTVVGAGDPQLVFTDDGEVMMIEVPL
jgi:hypothetical protein